MPASKTLVAIGATADIRIAIGSLEMTRLTHSAQTAAILL
jgi:hypothetical protein